MGTVDIVDFARYLGLSMWAQNIKASPLRLQKLLYYSQAWHLVFFGRENTLFDTAPEAWVNGPVYPSVYQKYKGRTANMCDGLALSVFESSDAELLSDIKALEVKMNLTEDQVRLFSSVVSLYGTKRQNQLILLTHCEKPWCEARGELMPYEASSKKSLWIRCINTIRNVTIEGRSRMGNVDLLTSDDIWDIHEPSSVGQGLSIEDTRLSQKVPIVVNYSLIDLDSTEYNFKQEFSRKDTQKYFEVMIYPLFFDPYHEINPMQV